MQEVTAPHSEPHGQREAEPSVELLLRRARSGLRRLLPAASLQALGRLGATDVIGGFWAWRAAGLPVVRAAVP